MQNEIMSACGNHLPNFLFFNTSRNTSIILCTKKLNSSSPFFLLANVGSPITLNSENSFIRVA
jgi:hypothetical protein